MRRRTRTFIGASVMIGFVLVYALGAMALAQGRPLLDTPPFVRGLIYVVLGLVWVVPLMPLIKWMERPDV